MRMRFSTDLHFSKPPGSPVPARVMCSWYAVDHVNTHISICTVAEASAAASAGESVRSALPMAAIVSIGMARWIVAFAKLPLEMGGRRSVVAVCCGRRLT